LTSHRTWRGGTYQITTLLAVVVLLLILFVSAAYVLFLPVPDPLAMQKQVLADLQAGRDKWDASRPRSYQYVVDRTCTCARAILEPYVASEESDYRTAAFPFPIESGTGELLTSPASPVWIDGLYTKIEESVFDGDEVVVEYDTSFGFPKRVDIKREAADTNMRYELRDFEVLEYR